MMKTLITLALLAAPPAVAFAQHKPTLAQPTQADADRDEVIHYCENIASLEGEAHIRALALIDKNPNISKSDKARIWDLCISFNAGRVYALQYEQSSR